MKKITALFLVAIIVCFMFAGCAAGSGISGKDILHNGIVYKRVEGGNFNIVLNESNSHYIGDFLETYYDQGYQFPWPVYALNSEENVLYSSHATWVKPGYSLPDNFGEAFSTVEYVITHGIDFSIMEDNYSEEATLLKTFDKVVKLEDIVEREPSVIEGYKEHDNIRFKYANHADISTIYTICELDGKYYLNVCQDGHGATEWHEIKSEYVDLLASCIPSAQ